MSENAHNNPILRCFLALASKPTKASLENVENLSELTINDSTVENSFENIIISKDDWIEVLDKRKQLIRNRWHLFYTLIQNQSLKQLRKQTLCI